MAEALGEGKEPLFQYDESLMQGAGERPGAERDTHPGPDDGQEPKSPLTKPAPEPVEKLSTAHMREAKRNFRGPRSDDTDRYFGAAALEGLRDEVRPDDN